MKYAYTLTYTDTTSDDVESFTETFTDAPAAIKAANMTARAAFAGMGELCEYECAPAKWSNIRKSSCVRISYLDNLRRLRIDLVKVPR